MKTLGWIAGSFVLLGVVLSGACLCDPSPSGQRGSAERCSYRPGDAALPAERTVEVGELRDDVFVPWSEGGDATIVRGFQGSDMLLPVVRVPALPSDTEDEVCANVQLRITTSDGEFTTDLAWVMRREGDFFQSGTIELPLFASGTATVEGSVNEASFTATIAPRTVNLR